ncbi:mitotic checkpoint serine/threonine-protein kinase BUB1 beta isoform X2 [Antennarius striatus]|uniref:mitotic checkpoint serine/threonine-protein kinase BUB1 beta isoform X2 n=1 Tax=Antennarius striatus TaxID=241820 RepID=UPI0035AE819E
MVIDRDVIVSDDWLLQTDRCVLIGPLEPGPVMDEGLLMPGGSSADTQSKGQGESPSQTRLSRGAGLQEEEGGANQTSAYCKELLMRGRTEFSFEELRAQKYKQQNQEQLDETLRRLTAVEERLSLELEEKTKLLRLRSSQRVFFEDPAPHISDCAPATPPFQIYDESLGGATDHAQTAMESRPHAAPQSKNTLSPIEESSVEAPSLTSLGEELEEMDHAPSPAPPAGPPPDPCDPDVRQRLLALCDITSSADLHSEPRPLPPVETDSFLQLGGVAYFIRSRVAAGDGFSVYAGAADDVHVRVKVDSRRVPWDFHQFRRLKLSSPSAGPLPRISCFLFLDGCVTVYAAPTRHLKFTEPTGGAVPPDVALVGRHAAGLLDLTLALHACGLVHAALQHGALTWAPGGSDCFPADWSSSLDLELQRDVAAVGGVPSAREYVRLGVLQPDGPPELVDLVGVAEAVHLLLTNERMVIIRDGDDGEWTAELFSADKCRYSPQTSCFLFVLKAIGSSWTQVDPVGSGWIRLGHVGSGWITLGPVGSGWITLGPVGSRWVRFCRGLTPRVSTVTFSRGDGGGSSGRC